MVTMAGDDQHYLPAALIGKLLRKAQIVVRELSTGEVHPAVLAQQAVTQRPRPPRPRWSGTWATATR